MVYETNLRTFLAPSAARMPDNFRERILLEGAVL
jgi:hypothetical protein